MQTTTQVSLRQLLIDAYNKRLESERQNNQEWNKRETERTKEEFEHRFGIELPENAVNGRQVKINDVTLVMDDNNCWAIKDHCPHCGEEAASPFNYDLSYLGQYLVEFRTNYNHFCPSNQAVNFSWQQRLTEAITEAIAEQIHY